MVTCVFTAARMLLVGHNRLTISEGWFTYDCDWVRLMLLLIR
jgi:hypothetical protein